MNVLIAGGGTGGHLFPAMAVAEEFGGRFCDAQIAFVGTKKGLESRVIPLTTWDLFTMDVPSFKGRGILRRLVNLCLMPRAFLQAWKIISRISPDIVVGVGGYAAGPVTLLAALRGIPTVALEQNAVAGMTNRILGHFVKKVFVTFAESARYFPAGKTVVSGNPVRKKILKSCDHPQNKKSGFTVLVFGGSQGAKTINDKMIDALAYLEDIKEDLHIIHQVGRTVDTENFVAAYRARGFSAEVYHFIEDMGKAYCASDLVVCRAGATSVAELTVTGKPAVLIPYPFAADDHQAANAASLASGGGAVVVADRELTGAILADTIRDLVEEPLKLASMSEAMRRAGRPDAAEVIVSGCAELAAKCGCKK